MKSFDQSLKYLLQHEPADFIRFGLGDPTVEVLEALPTGLPARGRDVDGAYLVAHGDRSAITDADKRVVHIELHRRHQSAEELGVDVTEAQIRLFRRERRRVLTQVWDLYGDAGAPLLEARTMIYGDGSDASRCTYQRVNLRALSFRELLQRGPPSLWSLVALTRDGAAPAAVEEACGAIEAHTTWSSGERADHLAVLLFVAAAEGMPAQVMKTYLAEGRLMESVLYKMIFEKGEAATHAATVLRILSLQTNEVDPAVRERVRAASESEPEALRDWYEDALRAVDAEAARRLVDRIMNAPIPTAGDQRGAA